MYQVVRHHILAERRRLAGVGLAVMLSVALLALGLLAGEALRQGLRTSVGSEFAHIDLAVESIEGPFSSSHIARAAEVEGVAQVQPAATFWTNASANGRSTSTVLAGSPEAGDLRDAIEITSGRIPEAPGEIVMDRQKADELRLELGDQVAISVPDPDDPEGNFVDQTSTVVGLWTGGGRYGASAFDTIVHGGDWQSWSANLWITRVYVVAEPGASPEDLAVAVGNAMAVPTTYLTRAELIDREMVDRQREWDLLQAGINAFSLLTLAVAGIVVSNTFAILVTQRTRDIALLRCAGATTRQVRGLVLAESAIAGLVAALAGVLAAGGIAQIALAIVNRVWDVDILPTSVPVPPSVVLLSLLAGTLVAIVAALAPARSATRVEPVQALRAAHAPGDASHQIGRGRAALALLILLGGGFILLAGMYLAYRDRQQFGVLVGMFGGLVSFIGVLLAASLVVPPVARALGSFAARSGGVPARVAASNCIRNPRRTTATAMALVIGVTLVSMMSVGSESLKATLANEVDAQVPRDIQVVYRPVSDGDVLGEFVDAVGALDNVEAHVHVDLVSGWIVPVDGGERVDFELRVVDPGQFQAVWRNDDAVTSLAPGRVLLPMWVEESFGIEEGDTIRLEGGGELASPALAVQLIDFFEGPIVTRSDLARVEGDRSGEELWLRLEDRSQSEETVDAIYDLADDRGIVVTVASSGDYRATLERALDTMLLIVTGLLAIAVVIAIIGVSNTLTLSVIERTRESALLRALGFTRRQLRWSLAIEGALLALIGSVIGIMLGMAYGWIGTLTLVGNTMPVALSIPFGRIGAIVLVAIACGLVASVLPAQRAASAEPAAALAAP